MPKIKLRILEERCKGCGLCVEFCPKKVLSFSEKRNLQGYKVVYFKEPERCNACGICYLMCPEVVFVEEEETSL
jgi:2-oxoglutarate ferredoxin oxidoreductase subunit delta